MPRINPFNSVQKTEEKLKPPALPTLAERVSKLAKEIETQWEALAPEALAEKIIDFQDCLSLENFPGVKKMRQLADNYHFQFVFPIVRDFKEFAKSIGEVANEILKTNSLAPFSSLSPTQQKEILRGTV